MAFAHFLSNVRLQWVEWSSLHSADSADEPIYIRCKPTCLLRDGRAPLSERCDRHLIPARKTEPEHYHLDLRFMIEADPEEPLVISNESKDLAWVEVARVTSLNPEESMARMVRKTIAR